MAIKDWFGRSKPNVTEFKEEVAKEAALTKTVVVHTNVLDRPSKTILKGFNVRQGMWVVTPDGSGIVTGLVEVQGPTGTFTHIKVMLVDSVGENKREVSFLPKDVKQAKHGEIPAARRPEKVATHLGYEL